MFPEITKTQKKPLFSDPEKHTHDCGCLEITIDKTEEIRMGPNNCSECGCPKFEGNGDICDNCGHNYGKHW